MNYINTGIAVPSAQGVSKRPLKITNNHTSDTKSELVNA